MIRVMIERKLKKGEHVPRVLRQLRMGAMARRGYIGGETLVSTDHPQIVCVMSTWRSLEDWKAWEVASERIELEREIEPLLAEPMMVKTYKVVSPEELEYLEEDPTTWGV